MIDLGSEGRDQAGGKIVVAGTLEGVAVHPTSGMGKSLKQVLERHPPEVLAGWGGLRGFGVGVRVAWAVTWGLLQGIVRSEPCGYADCCRSGMLIRINALVTVLILPSQKAKLLGW